MSHNHDHSHTKNRNILLFAFLFTLFFAIFEVISALVVHSLALLSEGIHMFSDGISLGISFFAAVIALKPLSKNRTFGSRRIETLAAFINGLTLIGIPIYVFIEAIIRFFHPQPIMSKQMLLVAFVGLVINSIVAYALSKGDAENNLNVRAAALHVISDLVSSVSVIIASLLIMKFHWTFIDPLVSALVSIVILKGGLTITKEAWNVLMEGTPQDVNIDEITNELHSLKGIKDITKLQIWSIASGENYINLHIHIDETTNEQEILAQLQKITDQYHLHETIQITK